MDHRASQDAGDAVQDPEVNDHLPAELVQAGCLHSGDDVVGASEVLSQLHAIEVCDRVGDMGDMGDLADLGLDQHLGAQDPALTSSASDRALLA